LLLLFVGELGAQDAAQKAQELEALRAQIETLQRQFEVSRKKKSAAEKRLQDVERQIGEISRALRSVEEELRVNQGELRALQGEQQGLQDRLKTQRERLAGEARSAYAMGREQQVKLLLNQEQPAAVGRMLVYFGYFTRARLQQIDVVRATLDRLTALEESIAQKNASLMQLRTSRQLDQQRLQEKKKARKQAVASLSRELENQGGELKRLQSDERQLHELVSSLQELLVDIPSDVSQQQPFDTLKGKLRWPTRGRLTKRFGTRRGGDLKWRGVMIEAEEGGEVRAVSQGRIAFSDWMRGFGLLVIIDHGDGYMSLYGHNQALYKEVGEWVDSGEVVALLGSSGGQTHSGLYFELRHKGRPINPVRWCSGKPSASSG
jgi:septal ring factor EnvC (AmiA/AmiB activator)